MRENPDTKTGLAESHVSRQKDQQGNAVSGGGVMIYRALAESSGDPIFLYDQEGLFIYANQACAKFIGCEPSRLEGRPLTDFFPDEVAKEMLNHIQDVFCQNNVVEKDYTIRSNGDSRYFLVTLAPVRNDEGQVASVVGTAKDITERKREEEELKAAEERLRILFEYAPDAYCIHSEGTILDANRQFEQITGYERNELVGKNYAELGLLSPEEVQKVAKLLADQAAGEVSEPVELSLRRKSGDQVIVETRTFPVNIRGQNLGLAIARDVTLRKRMEAEMKEMERNAELASRLASIGAMSAGIAHEINNPLTCVIGFADLLMKKDIPEDIRKHVNSIHRGSQRVASVVSRLLTFARQCKPERTYIDIDDILKTTLELQAYRMETSNIKVITQLAPELPRTMADAGQLQQVFLNIIINAEAAIEEVRRSGIILIRTERVGDTIRISLKDDGPGIAPENMGKLFNPFFTTRGVGKGTGLGLSVCHGIIAEHHGRIYAESEPGKGATFIVELPIVPEEIQPEKAQPVAPSKKVTGARILVVDDEQSIRDLLSEVLAGHRVEAVDNASDALDKIKSERYDVILLDIKLPGKSGIDLYEEIEKLDRPLAGRVIFVTGDVMGLDTKEFFSRTKACYITKPFHLEELDSHINRMLAQAI